MSDYNELSLPGAASGVARDKPEVWNAFEQLGAAVTDAGPLDDRSRRLVIWHWLLGAIPKAPRIRIAEGRLKRVSRPRNWSMSPIWQSLRLVGRGRYGPLLGYVTSLMATKNSEHIRAGN
jgi:hypothetical protein